MTRKPIGMRQQISRQSQPASQLFGKSAWLFIERAFVRIWTHTSSDFVSPMQSIGKWCSLDLINKLFFLNIRQKTCPRVYSDVYSDSFELAVLTEQIKGEEGLDLEDHLLLVRQRVVTDRVRHHHCQLKLHREKKKNDTSVANSRQIFRPIRRKNLAQLKGSPPSLPAQTIHREKQIHTNVANSWQIFRPIRRINLAQLKIGTITASSNYTERKTIPTNVAYSWQIFRPIRRINVAQLKDSAPSLPAQTTHREKTNP